MTSSGGMFPRLTSGPNWRTNQACEAFVGASKMTSDDVDPVDDLVDQAGAHLAGRAEDPGRAALAPLGDHLPGAGRELLGHPLDPLVGREDDLRVLRADLGEDDEVAREVGDQLELSLALELDRPVRDLDVGEALAGEPAPVLVEAVAGVGGLEERAAADDRDVLGADRARPSPRGSPSRTTCPSRA